MELFFKRLIQRKEQLSRLENQVLEYMMEHPTDVVDSTLDELSKKIYASTATISRTCKALGYSGYQELRIVLTQYVLKKPAQSNVAISVDPPLNSTSQRVMREVSGTLEQLAHFDLNQALTLIQNSRNIEFIGVGASYTNCVEAARKLTFAGRPSNAREDWDELRAVAQAMTPEDLAVVVSYSGETLHIMEYTTILSNNQVPILAITGDNHNTLAQRATLNCPVTIETRYLDNLDLSSRVPLSLGLEYIVHAYIIENHSL
ncbi:MurR/RpiR family transcriptional regulator [Vagococcus sp. BWB3-3]|uniref:MurR/RpiR family transcriptional regulator n=1 Tax=Vagococcus allomyrinae TaxID=2794353 RepID=A0A940PH14_9ENTE|nr:MurR/RpiR family transcriptional regulator [Vagococcus allomyrinae]MBP1042758.1 MurR/RpiR family transcriptional regulator [Vagococcus allomyrinae]